MYCILAGKISKDKTLSSFFLMKPKALETKDWFSVAIFVFLSMFGMTGLTTSFLSGGMEITIQCVDSVWLFLFSSVCLEWPDSQPLFFQEGWRSQFTLLTSKQDQIGALLGCIFCTCHVSRYAVMTKYMDSRFFVKFLPLLWFYYLLILLLLGFV